MIKLKNCTFILEYITLTKFVIILISMYQSWQLFATGYLGDGVFSVLRWVDPFTNHLAC